MVLPNGIDDTRQVSVMVELEGEPVAVVQAKARGREFSRAEKDAIKADLKARQDAIKSEIAARGGRVLGQVQSAYNGMRVQIRRADAAELATLPNVVAVRGLEVHTIDNAVGVPYIGAPAGLAGLRLQGRQHQGRRHRHRHRLHARQLRRAGHGQGLHAADRKDTKAANPSLFGPNAPKVKGGFDFVGDAYDASADDRQRPDPAPGSESARLQVTARTWRHRRRVRRQRRRDHLHRGLRLDTTHDVPDRSGRCAEADLYALRVFGCDGSTDVTVEAIDWAVDNDMDVINMSLGSPFGRADDPSAVASTNAADAGVIVVSSAGNEGPSQYITGSPGTGDGSISWRRSTAPSHSPACR